MVVGVPRETKIGENRVGLTPGGVQALAEAGHEVLVERAAGERSGFPDGDYQAAGARLVSTQEAWSAKLVIKVKEPIKEEYEYLRPGLLLFTYLHLAADRPLTLELIQKRVTAVAYETVEVAGRLPLLDPMSEVAGRMATQVGAHYLERTYGGAGKLLGGVTGVDPAKVTIIGSGVVGTSAAEIAVGMQAEVVVIDQDRGQLRATEDRVGGRLKTLVSNRENIERSVVDSDLVIGAVAITGAQVPKLVTRSMLRRMRPGSVFVDVAIDQGGCAETSRATTHEEPVYVEEDVIHYCVANMPGAVPHTSTMALTSATLPYVLSLAGQGLEALRDPALAKGVNTHEGKVTHRAVAEAFDLECEELAI